MGCNYPKATSIEVFGRYIHTYKFDEGVADGVVLDLRYEYRDIPQEIMSQAKIDAWFDAKTRGLMPRAKARLKQVWGNMQTVYSSRSRLEKIVCDIIFDFETKARFDKFRRMQLNCQSGAGKLCPHQIVASYYCLAYDAVRAVLTERIGSDLYKEMVAASWAFVYTNAKNVRFPPERKPHVLLVGGSRPQTPFSKISFLATHRSGAF